MATWAFICRHCQWVFTYSKIGETLADFIAEVMDEEPMPRRTKHAIRKWYGEIYRIPPKAGGALAHCMFCPWSDCEALARK
jgi:hypothetical protein